MKHREPRTLFSGPQRWLRAAAIGAVLMGVAVPSSAQAMASSRLVAAAGGGTIPAVVKPNADLAAQVPGPQVTWVDSIFIAGHVRGGGHNFGILVHTLAFPNADQRILYIGLTDTSTGWYRNYEAMIPQNEYMWSSTGLQITMPGLTWTGSVRQMEVKATTPWGSLEARFVPRGPTLNYSGNGLVPLLGDVDYEYAFPVMRTVGTLAAEGRTFQIAGVSWLDRQWGPVPVTNPSMRWTWMNIALSNGDQLALWDILDDQAQSSWVTLLRPDGSYQMAAVRPLASGQGAFWTSRVTGKTYPTRWHVDIPALQTRLSVAVSGPKGQEFRDGHVEAIAAVTGSFQGTNVTGTTYIEMTGDWKAPG